MNKDKKIFIIGSSQYIEKMKKHRDKLITVYKGKNIEMRLPNLDDCEGDSLDIGIKNRENMEWCDEVHVFWDQRSTGTIFDFGMAFALRKPIKIIYMEKKTFKNAFELYEQGKGR